MFLLLFINKINEIMKQEKIQFEQIPCFKGIVSRGFIINFKYYIQIVCERMTHHKYQDMLPFRDIYFYNK